MANDVVIPDDLKSMAGKYGAVRSDLVIPDDIKDLAGKYAPAEKPATPATPGLVNRMKASLADASPPPQPRPPGERRGGMRTEGQPYVAPDQPPAMAEIPIPDVPGYPAGPDAAQPSSSVPAADGVPAYEQGVAPSTVPGGSMFDRPADPNLSFRDASQQQMALQQRTGAALGDRMAQTKVGPATPAQSLAFDIGEATSNPVARGGIAGVASLGKIGVGAVRIAADLFGADRVANAARGASGAAEATEQGAMQGLSGNDKLVADVTNSIINSAPSLAVGMVGGPALRTLFVQSTLAEYNAGRDAGFDPGVSLARAGIMGTAEALGERFGFPEQIKLLKSLSGSMPTGQVAHLFGELLKKEIPGEQLTTAMQFLADKVGPAALQPNASMADYLEAAGETLKVTVAQTGVMGGGPTAVATTRNALANADAMTAAPETRVAAAIDQGASAYGRFFTPPADAAAVPTQARTASLKRFDELAAAFGLSPAALTAVRAQAGQRPAGDVPGFLQRVTESLNRRGLFRRPVDEASVSALHDQLEAAATADTQPAAPALAAPAPAEEPATPATSATDDEDYTGLAAPSSGPSFETPVDAFAHDAATSPINDRAEPTEAQKAAGNYAKGHVRIGGLDIAIENPQGSVRRGVAADGTAWETPMAAHYGYVKGTLAGDGDHSDVFIKPGTPNDYGGPVFVIDQVDPTTGKFDEHKSIIGAGSEEEARALYQANYADGWQGLGAITQLPLQAFKSWVRDGVKRKPLGTLKQPETVRMFHGGEPGDASGPMWFSQDQRYAEGYAKKSGGRVWYVDVPSDHPALGGDAEFGVLPPTNVELPADIAAGRKELKRAQPDVAAPAAAADGAVARAGDQSAGSDSAVRPSAGAQPRAGVGPAEPVQRTVHAGGDLQRPAAAPESGGGQVGAVGDGAAGDAALTPRALGSFGRAPSAADTVELRPNADGTVTPHTGKYPMVDFDSGNPIVLPAEVSEADAVTAIRKAGAVTDSAKFFSAAPRETKAEKPAPTGMPAVGTKIAIDGEAWTVRKVGKASVSLEGHQGKKRTVATDSPTWKAVLAKDAPATEEAPESAPASEGPKVYKLRDSAEKARKEMGNTHRVRQVKGGFILREATDKELAAAERAGRRLAGHGGVDVDKDSLLTALAKLGGISMNERADTIGEGNRNIAGKMLFTTKGKSLDLLAAEDMREFGYVPQDEVKRDGGVRWLRDAIAAEFMGTKVHHSEQGTGWLQDRFKSGLEMSDDELQAARDADEAEQAAALSDFTVDDLGDAGYTSDSPEAQALTEQLLAEADALGIDIDSLRERAALQHEGATADEFHTQLQAIAERTIAEVKSDASRGDTGRATSRAQDHGEAVGQEGEQGAQHEGLTAPTPESLRAADERARTADASDRREQQRLADKAKADAERDEFTLTGSNRAVDVGAAAGQGGLFDAPIAQSNVQARASESSKPLSDEGNSSANGVQEQTNVANDELSYTMAGREWRIRLKRYADGEITWTADVKLANGFERVPGDKVPLPVAKKAGALQRQAVKQAKQASEGGLFDAAPSRQPAPRATSTKAQPGDSEAIRKAKADLMAGLGDLAGLLSKNTRANIAPEQEQQLLPILTKVFDAAFRLGYLKFKDAAKFVLHQVRAAIGNEAADAITLDHLQGAYIGMAGRYKEQGASSKKDVVSVEDKAEIEAHEADNAKQETAHVPDANSNLERDRQDAGAENAAVESAVPGDGPAEGAGSVGGRTSSARRGRPSDPGFPTRRPPAAGEPGNQPVHRGDGEGQPALFPARDPDGQRSDDPGFQGVQPETVAASDVAAAAAGGMDDVAKRRAQREADGTPVVQGDLANIRATLPYLLPGQQEDVHFSEKRFAKPDGYGVLFTNGTGTGKTFSGLGLAKRFARQGKTNILVLVPDQKIMDDWVDSGRALGLTLAPLADTRDAGRGITITTYANAGDNDALATRAWDLVVPDEAHSLMQAAEGDMTKSLEVVRAITLHPKGRYRRFDMLHRPELERRTALGKQIDANEKIASADDTMDATRDSVLLENVQLRKQWDALNAKLEAAKASVFEHVDANQGAKRPRLAALSATPFAYVPTIEWAEGYLFDYGAEPQGRGYNTPSAQQAFFMQHFGYRMRYGKLTKPDAKVDSGLMERQFNTWLKKSGAVSGRMLDVHADYDRRFIMAESKVGNDIDRAREWIREQAKALDEKHKADKVDDAHNGFSFLGAQLAETFEGPHAHLTRRYLLEAIKAKEVVRHVREHLALGRKVVVFHDFKAGGSVNPFRFTPRSAPAPGSGQTDIPAAREAYNAAARAFDREFPDLAGDQLLADLISPVARFTREFPDVLLINGDQKKADLLARYKRFQDDASGPMVMLVQSDKNKGWSGHDTTGKHQRVLFNLGLPTQPTKTIQTEGRIYRTGQKSDAIMRYLNTGTDWERWAFAQTIATRASTAENLGMGEQARSLKDSYISALQESGDFPAGHEGEGKGGKERDRAATNALSEYDRAKAFYWGTQKKNAKTKAQEGADYYATPEPLGLKVVQWGDVRGGESSLEPSAGHGAIARWLPDNVTRTAIEPSAALSSRLALVFDGKIIRSTFEDLNVVNKFDTVHMNPPFGTAGRTAVDHVAKAATHLREGGRIVALIPEGSTNEKFDKWFYGTVERPRKPLAPHPSLGAIYAGDTLTTNASWAPKGVVVSATGDVVTLKVDGMKSNTGVSMQAVRAIEPTGKRTETIRPAAGLYLAAEIRLPAVTFERAGTAVRTRVVVIDKMAGDAGGVNSTGKVDLSDITDINELFDRLENIDVPRRQKAEEPTADSAPVAAQEVRAAAKAEKKEAQQQGQAQAAASGLPVVEHVTGKGKTLRGVVRTDLNMAQAKQVDQFTFKKDGGFFIRLEHLPTMMEKYPPSAPAFRRAVPGALAVDQVQQVVDSVTAAWANAPRVVVVPDLQDARLPSAVQEEDTRQRLEGATGLPSGVVYQGTVYVVADAMQAPNEVVRTLFHEALGHMGLRGAFGEALSPMLDQLAMHNREAVAAKARDYGYSMDDPAQRRRAAEEVLAELAETRPQSSWVKQAIAAIRTWLRSNNLLQYFTADQSLSDAEIIRTFIAPARRYIEQGEAVAGAGAEVPMFSRQPQHDAVTETALARAGIGGPPSARTKVAGYFNSALDQVRDPEALAATFRQGALDQFHGIRQAVTREIGNLPVEQDPYIAARLANGGTSSVMRALLLHGQARWAANGQHMEKVPGTEGLLDVLAPLGNDVNDWFGWMIGNRAARLMREGRENNFTPEQISALQSLATPENRAAFQKASIQFAAFKRSVLDIGEGAGIINPESRQAWDHADYIPFYREIDDKAVFGATGRRGLAGQSSGIRTLKGGTAALNDPMENVLMNFSRLVDASLKNNAIRKTIAALADTDAVHKVGYDMGRAIVPADQVRRQLIEAGTPAAVLDAIPAEAFEGMAKMWSIQAPTDPDVVRVMDGGRPQFYRVNDPLLLRSLTSFVPFDFPGLGLMRGAKRLLTAMVTSTPEFMIRNWIRDSVATQAIGRGGFNPAASVTGIAKSFREMGGFESMLFAGASFQSGNINAADPKGTAIAMRRALRSKGLDASAVDSFMGTVVDTTAKFWEHYRSVGEAIENANRQAVFEAAGKTGASTTAAAYEAKDLMDFSLRGSWPAYQLLADVLPFFNARVQGLYRLGRADPKRLMTVGMTILLASVMLGMANDGEPWYEELPDWDKDTYWHFRIGGKHFRLPKPFEIGVIFATVPERIGRSIKGLDAGKKTASRLWANLRDQLAFDPVPQMIRPALNVWGNQDTFRDAPIESLADEGKLPHLRYNARTSSTMRALTAAAPGAADAMALSPKRLEYLVNGYLGTVGMYALGMSDMLVNKLEGKPPGPSLRADDLPVVRSFYRDDPARGTVFETDLYKMKAEVDQIYRSITSSVRDNPGEARRLLLEEKDKIKVRGLVVGATKALAELGRERDRIYADPNLTPDQKREKVDALQQRRNDVARKVATDPRVKAAF